MGEVSVRLLVVEDEHIIAARLTRLLGDILGPRLVCMDLATSLPKARDLLAKQSYDLVFLDLNLRGKNGFDLLKQAVSEPFQTVIVSAHTEHALKAFEYGVLDFVGKPFDKARLEVSVERFLSRERTTRALRYLAVKQVSGTVLIALDEIVYIRGAGAYAELVLEDGRELLHGKSLDKLTQLLPQPWERVHKSYLVSLANVTQWHSFPGSKYELELNEGTRLPVSRRRYKELRAGWV